jgi:hypothetical protein
VAELRLMADEGGPAFPQPATSDGFDTETHAGMSLRDWFAGQALAGMGTWMPAVEAFHVGLTEPAALHARAAWAYQQADAMILAMEAARG